MEQASTSNGSRAAVFPHCPGCLAGSASANATALLLGTPSFLLEPAQDSSHNTLISPSLPSPHLLSTQHMFSFLFGDAQAFLSKKINQCMILGIADVRTAPYGEHRQVCSCFSFLQYYCVIPQETFRITVPQKA